MTPHTAAHRGKRIRVTLKDGTTFIDKFVERVGKTIIFEKHKVEKSNITAFSIYKGVIL